MVASYLYYIIINRRLMVIYRDLKIGGSANQLLLNLDKTLRQMLACSFICRTLINMFYE